MNIIKIILTVVVMHLNNSLYAAEPVKYLDENGQEQYVTDYSELTGAEDTLRSGWYVVTQSELINEKQYEKFINIDGDVRIILCDNTIWDRRTDDYICSNSGSILRFYAQSQGENMGRLVVYENKVERAFYSLFFDVDSLVINGGFIECVGIGKNSPACIVRDLTINGGQLSISNVTRGITCSNLHLNGGILKVNATDFAVGVGEKLTIGKSYCDVECECTSILYYGDDDISIPDFVSVKVGDKEYTGVLPYDFTDLDNVTRITAHYDAEAALGINGVHDDVADDVWYTLSGIRLKSAPTEKGVYIHNGTKEQIR